MYEWACWSLLCKSHSRNFIRCHTYGFKMLSCYPVWMKPGFAAMYPPQSLTDSKSAWLQYKVTQCSQLKAVKVLEPFKTLNKMEKKLIVEICDPALCDVSTTCKDQINNFKLLKRLRLSCLISDQAIKANVPPLSWNCSVSWLFS